MNTVEKYQLVQKLQKEKSSMETVFELAIEIIEELTEKYPKISTTELGILTDCYSKAYLGTADLKNIEENLEYVDMMMRYLEEYLEWRQDDAHLLDNCIFTLICALYYEEAYNLCMRFYMGSRGVREVSLKWLSSGLFEGDEFVTKEETAAYQQEYTQLVPEAKQSSPE